MQWPAENEPHEVVVGVNHSPGVRLVIADAPYPLPDLVTRIEHLLPGILSGGRGDAPDDAAGCDAWRWVHRTPKALQFRLI